MTPVFILGLGENGYGILRSLVRERVRAVGFHATPVEFARYSKYCETQFLPPSLDDAQICRALIERARREASKPVLFPTSDYYTSVLAKHREELSQCFQFHWVGTEDLRRIVDKAEISRACRDAGVLTPRTHVTRPEEELASLAGGWSFPGLVKPTRSFNTAWKFPAHVKTVIVASPEELRAFYRAHPQLKGETIFQEIIEGGDDAIFQCTALIRSSGEPGAVFCARKLHQYRPGYGVMCFGRSEENEVVAAQRLLNALQYRGLASLEFKHRAKDGRYYFIEMNPRLPWYSALFSDAGVNLPYLAYLDLTAGARSTPSIPRQRNAVHWINFEYNLGWFVLTLRKGRFRLLEWLYSIARARSYAWFEWRDPQPFLRATMNLFGRLGQKLHARVPDLRELTAKRLP
jgi:D-aspartate ligase